MQHLQTTRWYTITKIPQYYFVNYKNFVIKMKTLKFLKIFHYFWNQINYTNFKFLLSRNYHSSFYFLIFRCYLNIKYFILSNYPFFNSFIIKGHNVAFMKEFYAMLPSSIFFYKYSSSLLVFNYNYKIFELHYFIIFFWLSFYNISGNEKIVGGIKKNTNID